MQDNLCFWSYFLELSVMGNYAKIRRTFTEFQVDLRLANVIVYLKFRNTRRRQAVLIISWNCNFYFKFFFRLIIDLYFVVMLIKESLSPLVQIYFGQSNYWVQSTYRFDNGFVYFIIFFMFIHNQFYNFPCYQRCVYCYSLPRFRLHLCCFFIFQSKLIVYKLYKFVSSLILARQKTKILSNLYDFNH